MAKKNGGSIWGALSAIAGIAVSIAVPFLAPSIATAIFGSSVMGALGGLGGILATAGTGALLGGAGAALTGGNWQTGAVLGGLGGGAVQGLGALGGGVSSLFSGASAAPALGATAAAAPAAAAGLTATPVAGGALGSAFTGGWGSAAGLGSAAPAAAAGLGAFQMPWDKLFNAGLAAAPTLLGAALPEVLPPSDQAQGLQDAFEESLKGQKAEYKMALKAGRDIDPHYFAQTAANSARLRTAGAMEEGNRAVFAGLNDPARMASENRRAAVGASMAGGQAYNDAYLTALQAKQGAASAAAGLRPQYADYAEYLAKNGIEAEKEKRAEDWTSWLSPFFGAFAKTNTGAQAGTA